MTLKQSDLTRFTRLVGRLIKPTDIQTICLIPHGGSLKLCAFGKDAMLTFIISKEGFCDPFAIRWDDLKKVSGKKSGDVTFNLTKDAVHVRSGEEQNWFGIGKKVNALPNRPSTTSTFHAVSFFASLVEATRCTDPDNISRTALNGICLRGNTSQIISTTGSQLLVQDGYDFSWKDSDVVCPSSKIFASKELKELDDNEVLLGLVNGFVYFSIGSVEFYLKAIDGVFPKVEGLLAPAEGATFLTVDPGDADFVLSKIDKLPGSQDHEKPIYLSLDVAAWIRAYERAHKTGITLELSRSAFSGVAVSISLNRNFLKNALQFGCHKIGIDPAGDAPLVCTGDGRTFVCMPLSSSTEPETEHMDVIASADSAPPAVTPTVAPKVAAAVAVTTPAPVVKRRRKVTTKRDAVKQTGEMALLQTAETIRNDLRNSLLQVNALIREVKAQRRQNRLLQSTMDNLRKLSL